MRHDRHLVKETRIVVENATINSVFFWGQTRYLIFFFSFFFFLFTLPDCFDTLYYTCGSHPSGFQEASKGIWCYNVCSALDCSFVCLINGLKYGKTGNKKCVTCFATLLQNELNSDVARFTTHIKPVLQQIRLLCIGQIEEPPGHLTFLKIIVQIPPYPGQNDVQMPHTRIHSGDQMPPPRGHFTGTKMTEGRRKRLQLSNKIFINITKTEKHC